LDIGRIEGVGYMEGKIDDVKLYDYARTQGQVSDDYNRGGPIAWWKFDECQGTRINDSSGRGITGTVTLGAGGNTTVGTCQTASSGWGNSTGKFNGGFNFDGVDDYIDLTDNDALTMYGTRSYSWSFWIKPDTDFVQDEYPSIFMMYSYDDGFEVYTLTQSSTTYGPVTQGVGVWWFNSCCELWLNTIDNVITTNAWNHIVITYDRTFTTANERIKIYVNGKNVTNTSDFYCGSCASIGTIDPSTTYGIWLGCGDYDCFDGTMDDSGMFNYALSEAQIKKLYNEGSSVRFGP
jgi:hypothetical protein